VGSLGESVSNTVGEVVDAVVSVVKGGIVAVTTIKLTVQPITCTFTPKSRL
jgi:hypothetical protein